MEKIRIHTATSRKANPPREQWEPQDLTFKDLAAMNETPKRSSMTAEGVKKLIRATEPSGTPEARAAKEKLDAAKDRGGYFCGALKGNERSNKTVINRTCLTLDADTPGPDLPGAVSMLGYSFFIHETFKSTPEARRFRVVIPFSRPLPPDDYPKVARAVADEIGAENFDPSTHEPARFMYWGARPADADYYYFYQDGPALNPDRYIARAKEVPTTAQEGPSEAAECPRIDEQEKKVLGDPREKPGEIGAFCRAYDVPAAIGAFLSDVYQHDGGDRYTLKDGTGTKGLHILDKGQHCRSYHGTDRARGETRNSFDLCRVQLFEHLDKGIPAATPRQHLPSHEKMLAFAADAPKVKAAKEAEAEAAQVPQEDNLPPSVADLMADGGPFFSFLKKERARKIISTGYAALDDITAGGFYEGLWCFGGLPGTGKSGLAWQMANAAAEQGRPSVYVTLEVAADELIARAVSSVMAANGHPTPYSDILRGRVIDAEILDAASAYLEGPGQLARIKQAFFGANADDVARYAYAVKAAEGQAPIVFVDYLQALTAQPGKYQELREKTDQNIMRLKALSDELQTTVIVLSSFNRNHSKPGYLPSMAAFKESGGIEYTADLLASLWKPGTSDDDTKPRFEFSDPSYHPVHLSLLKNRRGSDSLTLNLAFQKLASRFLDEAEARREIERLWPNRFRQAAQAEPRGVKLRSKS